MIIKHRMPATTYVPGKGSDLWAEYASLIAHFCDQIINQSAEVAAIPGHDNGSQLLGAPGCIDACTTTI
jgi:hypothetical protein